MRAAWNLPPRRGPHLAGAVGAPVQCTSLADLDRTGPDRGSCATTDVDRGAIVARGGKKKATGREEVVGLSTLSTLSALSYISSP